MPRRPGPAAPRSTSTAPRVNREAATQRRTATDAEARALASTLRLRILRVCLYEPRTNKEIAGLLGKDPATTLHHVRRLVDTGFLAALEVRRGTRGAREIPYLATGKSWQLSNPSASGVLIEAFLEEVALVPIETVDTTRMGLRLTADERAEFDARLHDLVEEFRTRSDDRSTSDPTPLEAISIFMAVHPDPNSAPPNPHPSG
jgi:DNA-binding MarR family transcriptional regulator